MQHSRNDTDKEKSKYPKKTLSQWHWLPKIIHGQARNRSQTVT